MVHYIVLFDTHSLRTKCQIALTQMLLNINIIVSIITTILVNTKKTCHGFVNLKSSKTFIFVTEKVVKTTA